jgi:general secretion pathway protein F/type IV pilus assembly protein PilC
MVYPLLLGSAGTIVVSALIIFFVPKFAPMFQSLRERGELPWATDLLLSFSAFCGRYGLWVVGIAAIAGMFIGIRLKTPRAPPGRPAKIKIPLAGRIFLNFAVARFCRVLGTLLHNGVPILKALEISRDASGNRVLSEAIAKASENISSGHSLAGPLAQSGHFPKMVVEMIAVAEESNTLDTVLVNLSDDLDKRTSRQLT